MDIYQDLMQQSLMIKSKDEILQKAIPDSKLHSILQAQLLSNSSDILIPQNHKQMFVILGMFCYDIINNELQCEAPSPITSDYLQQLALSAFNIKIIEGLPPTPEFKKFGENLSASFEYMKYLQGRSVTQFKMVCGKEVQSSETTPINYRIIIYQDTANQLLFFLTKNQRQPPLAPQVYRNQPRQFQNNKIQVPQNCGNQYRQTNFPSSQQFQPFQQYQGRFSTPQQINQNNNNNLQNQQYHQQDFAHIKSKIKIISQTPMNQECQQQNLNQSDQFQQNEKSECLQPDRSKHQEKMQQCIPQSNNSKNFQQMQQPDIQVKQQQANNVPSQTNAIKADQFKYNFNFSAPLPVFQPNGQILYQSFQQQQNDELKQNYSDQNQTQQQNTSPTQKLNEPYALSQSPQENCQENHNNIVFTTEALNNASIDQDKGNSVAPGNFEILNLNQQSNIMCQICCCPYDAFLDSIMLPCCQQQIHKECLRNDLISKARLSLGLDHITCFNCGKSLRSYQEFLKGNIPINDIIKVFAIEARRNATTACFKCGFLIEIKENMKDNQFEYECSSCKQKICSICKEKYHGKNEKNQQCPRERKIILQALGKMPVVVCPFCFTMQSKDDKCNHVVCYQCKSQLCSACSVDRRPILGHGNHYHRKGCSDYKSWFDENKKVEITKVEFDPKRCAMCKEKNQPCQYPISLDEYKKQQDFVIQ